MDRRNFLKTSGGTAGGLVWAAKAESAGPKLSIKASGTGTALLQKVRLVDPEAGRTDERKSDIKIEKGQVSEIAPAAG